MSPGAAGPATAPELVLPPLPDGIDWSIEIAEARSGRPLAVHRAQAQHRTASIGKVFLLIEACTRIADGRLDPDAPLDVPQEHAVGDSGLLRWLRAPITVGDACLLVAAVSDNLATNALIHLCGLEAVRAVAPRLGLAQTSLWDYIRSAREPGMPWTASFGTAAELGRTVRLLAAGLAVSREVSDMVLGYLAADVDTSLVAGGLNLDALDHVEADDGIVLRHKTGYISILRADVGLAQGPAAAVSYAVLAEWDEAGGDRRIAAEDGMRAIGRAIRAHIRPGP